MWFHLTDKATGEQTTVASLSGYDETLYVIVELTREPSEFEDVIDGNLVHNAKREADTKAGPAHIAEAHIQKRVEAILIKAGQDVSGGLLLPEADERKITPEDMADLVLTKSAEFKAKELARQFPLLRGDG